MKIILFSLLFMFSKNIYASNICEDVPKLEKISYIPPVSMKVIGTGRLQFHASTFKECAIQGLFIIPNDSVIGYSTSLDDKWTEVMYVHPKTHKDSSGWVDSSRLKITGTIAPKR